MERLDLGAEIRNDLELAAQFLFVSSSPVIQSQAYLLQLGITLPETVSLTSDNGEDRAVPVGWRCATLLQISNRAPFSRGRLRY